MAAVKGIATNDTTMLPQPFLEFEDTLIGRISRLRWLALDNPTLCEKREDAEFEAQRTLPVYIRS